MKFALTTAITLVAFAAAPAFAQDTGFYGTIGYGNYSADDADLGAIQLRGGYNFNEFLGAEIEAGVGVADESTTIAGINANIELENSYGAYAVGRRFRSDRLCEHRDQGHGWRRVCLGR